MIRQHGRIRRLAAGVASLLLALQSATPAWSQRRGEEPQANPEFQSGGEAPASGGGPVGGAPLEGGASSDEGSAPAEAGEDDGPAAPKGGGLQIGAVAAPRAAPAAPLNPLEFRVTVRVKGAPLATFLDTISAQAKVNFIITEGLEAKQVTAFLQNVTVREALQILLEIKGLTYQQIGKSNTYVISQRSKAAEPLITRIYVLSYIPLINLEGDSAGAAASGGAGPASAATGGAAGGAGASGVSVVNVLQSVLSKSGHIALEPRNNSLIVTDIPEVFPQVEQIIAELDKKVPQVMIEAQIVEINSNRARDLGFEWGGTNGELVSFTGPRRTVSFPLSMPADIGKAGFFDPIDKTANKGPFGTALTPGVFDLTALKVTLRALVNRSEARYLGKPKILTLNNKSAVIEISADTAVGRMTSLTSAGSTGSSNSTAERKTTGLTLKVTPQVNKEGYITLLVQPSFIDVRESNISTSGDKVFDTVKRAASTLVRVKNGQTLVLGGLLQSTETKVIRKVPFLGYIPLLGWLFTTTSMKRQNSDLVIFITPTIVSD